MTRSYRNIEVSTQKLLEELLFIDRNVHFDIPKELRMLREELTNIFCKWILSWDLKSKYKLLLMPDICFTGLESKNDWYQKLTESSLIYLFLKRREQILASSSVFSS